MSDEATKTATYSGTWHEPEKITEVREDDEHWDIRMEGSGFCMEKKWGGTPKAGDTIELNTVSYSEIRGVKINGQQIYLKSDQDAEAEHANWKAKREQEQRAEYERDREKHAQTFEALPDPIKARIARLRTRNENFQWEMEPYELFLSSEAVKIANAMKTVDGVIEFSEASQERQKELVPDLEYSEHSGNTFGFAVKIAHMFLLKPGAVKFMHGAFAPIAGCDGVGCHPLTPEEEAEVAAL